MISAYFQQSNLVQTLNITMVIEVKTSQVKYFIDSIKLQITMQSEQIYENILLFFQDLPQW
jgi:hypothetical protein